MSFDLTTMSPVLTLIVVLVQLGLTLVLGVRVGLRLRNATAVSPGALVRDEHSQRAVAAALELRQLSADMMHRIEEHESRVGEFDQHVQGVDLDAPATQIRSHLATEIGRIADANRKVHDQLEQAHRTIQRQTRELSLYRVQSRTDPLTGTLNRTAMDEELSYLLALAARYDEQFAVLTIDVDHFGQINDLYGPAAGDELLRGVAQTLVGSMRKTDIVVRYGDDEFAVLLPRADGMSLAATAKRVCQIVRSATYGSNGVRFVDTTVSVGGALSIGLDTPESLLARANAALERCKTCGGDQAHFHDGREISRVDDVSIKRSPPSTIG